MGLRERLFLGFVFLLSGGNLFSAAQDQFSLSANETLNQTSPRQVTPSSQPKAADRQSKHMEPGAPPVRHRLRSYQLRSKHSPPAEETSSPSLQRSEGEVEQREPGSLLRPGPELNPLPDPPSKVQLEFEQRVPVPADSVSVHCGEGKVTVEVKQNFLGNGQLIHPTDLTLGGCPAADTTAHVLQFQTELHGCGSTMTMTEEALVYTFTLTYSPTPIRNTFILKTNPVKVGVQCSYQRRHRVSSGGTRPAWNQLSSATRAEQQLHFSLRLMTEDWQSQRPSSVYFLSDVMHVEASVLQSHHVPLRIYVDSCVATTSPSPYSQPQYSFIGNHGCFADAKLTGAKSYFLPRGQEDKLQFQLKAFKFFSDDKYSLYITCRLKASKVSVPIDPQHKACSYLTEAKRWVASGGDNEVCSCCESSCREPRLKRSLADDAGEDRLAPPGAAFTRASVNEAVLCSSVSDRPAALPGGAGAADRPAALLGGAGAALALLLSVVAAAAVICCRTHKPPGYSVCT
uniref:Zona pellucida sperm-binding protein 3 n=1 Tax=Salarias fasciatus TaxID=181472 RepID=A0A672FJJ0_SALFA